MAATYSFAKVHEVDGALLVGVVALGGALDVDIAPVDGLHRESKTGGQLARQGSSSPPRERVKI